MFFYLILVEFSDLCISILFFFLFFQMKFTPLGGHVKVDLTCEFLCSSTSKTAFAAKVCYFLLINKLILFIMSYFFSKSFMMKYLFSVYIANK